MSERKYVKHRIEFATDDPETPDWLELHRYLDEDEIEIAVSGNDGLGIIDITNEQAIELAEKLREIAQK